MTKLDFTKYFLLPNNLKDKVDILSKDDKCDLFDCILRFASNEEIEFNYFNKLSQPVKIIFLFLKEIIENQKEKYNAKITDKNNNNKYKIAGIISGIKRSKAYKLLNTEEEKEQYLNETLNNLTNVNEFNETLNNLTNVNEFNETLNNLTNVNEFNETLNNLTNVNEFNETLKTLNDIEQDVNEPEQTLNSLTVSEQNLTKDNNKDNINNNIKDIDKDNTSSSIIPSSSYFDKIKTLDKFNQWIQWWANNDDLEFEKWKKDNLVSDKLLREKIQAVRDYYSQPQNHTTDFKEALKKFIINDLKEV